MRVHAKDMGPTQSQSRTLDVRDVVVRIPVTARLPADNGGCDGSRRLASARRAPFAPGGDSVIPPGAARGPRRGEVCRAAPGALYTLVGNHARYLSPGRRFAVAQAQAHARNISHRVLPRGVRMRC